MGAGILKTKSSPFEKDDPVDNEHYDNDEHRERRAREREQLNLDKGGMWANAPTPALERQKAAMAAAAASAKETELAPLRKGIMDEIDFLGKRFGLNSKIGGRGAL